MKITKLTKDKKKFVLEMLAIILFNLIVVATVSNFYSKNNESVDALSKLGSRGSEVRQVQTKLKEIGLYTGTVDGIYGTRTQTAVKQFQKNCGIAVDGVAGPKTLLYLGITSGSSGGAYSTNDIYLIAKVIAAEARGESYTGQVAVGAIILNRVKHSSFPDTVSGVVYQSGAFTCVTDSNWSVEPTAAAKKAAQDAINGWDPTNGAIYYYNPAKTSNQWMLSRPVTITIGSHVFCK